MRHDDQTESQQCKQSGRMVWTLQPRLKPSSNLTICDARKRIGLRARRVRHRKCIYRYGRISRSRTLHQGTVMKLTHLFLPCAIFLFVDRAVAQENPWAYPAGRSGTNFVSAGRAGELRVYECETKDSIEKVVLWYGKRLRLAENHSLMAAASKGFGNNANHELSLGSGYDTGQRRDYTQVLAHLRKGGPHISLWHRPDFRQPDTITISIAKGSAATSIHVIEPLMRKAPPIPQARQRIKKGLVID